MPGAFAIAGTDAAGRRVNCALSTTTLPRMPLLRASPMPTFRPWANTATNTAIASPTMSADDVTAVRPGLRSELSRAMRPTPPGSRAIGQPITRTIVGTR